MRLVITVVYFTVHLVFAHICQHRVPRQHEFVTGVPIERSTRSKRAVSDHMRIHLNYDNDLKLLSSEKQKLIKTVVPDAVKFWERTLKVRQGGGVVRLLRQCRSRSVSYKNDEAFHYCIHGCEAVTKCGEVTVPQEHLYACRTCENLNMGCSTIGEDGAGVADVDFILYVSTETTPRCGLGTTVAYAAYCQLEGSLDRPIAGYVNVCPDSISTQQHDLKQIIATIKHEILHALGFSAGLFAYFRDASGEPLTPRNKATNQPDYNKELQLYQWSDRIVRKVTRDKWLVRSGYLSKDVHLMVTPKVKAEVRRHFNCPTLEGAELEDQGIIGTALTHWEKRVFEHEAMTGTYTQNPVISRITLALMEDTGWYHVNYSRAQPLDWGRNLGCQFVTSSCMAWMEARMRDNQSVHPYCNRPRPKQGLQTECSTDLKAVALCNLGRYDDPLPKQYQYMRTVEDVKDEDVGRYGGTVELADYCPYIQEFAWKENGRVVRNSACQSEGNSAFLTDNYSLEWYGKESICLVHDRPWILSKCNRRHRLDHWGSGCYKHRCEADKGLVIVVERKEHLCTRVGQLLRIRQLSTDYIHEGTILCPDSRTVCGWSYPVTNPPPAPVVEDLQMPCSAARGRLVSILLAGVLALIVL